jgi:hypothetical protein
MNKINGHLKMERKNILTNQDLDHFIELFDPGTRTSTRASKTKKAREIIKRYTIPDRYLEGLKGNERLLRQIELISKKRKSPKQRYSPLKSDIIAREKGIPKKGSCTERWERLYPDAKSNQDKSKITGIPKKIIDKVDNKGRGAYYSSGSRPGQTAESWGKARVNCFILNKKTVTDGPDRNLYEEAIHISPRAKEWFSKTKY